MPRKPQGKRINTADGSVAVRGKAPNGAGSVYPIADGSWRANWTDRTGRRRSVRGRTYAQAVSRREAAQAADDGATDATRRVPKRFSPRTTTMSDVAAWWLDQQRHRVRPSSLGKYADRIDRFNAVLGPELVSELTAEQVASWQSELLDELSPSTVADTRSTLVAVLGAAQDLGLVAANVAQRVKPPRVPKPTGRAITPDEVALCSWPLQPQARRSGSAALRSGLAGLRGPGPRLAGRRSRERNRSRGPRRRLCRWRRHGARRRRRPPVRRACIRWLLVSWTRSDAASSDSMSSGPLPVERWTGPHEYAVATRPRLHDDRRPARHSADDHQGHRLGCGNAGLESTRLGTHVGRRSVITALYAHGGASIDDIAHHVGHDSTATTSRRTFVTSAVDLSGSPRWPHNCST